MKYAAATVLLSESGTRGHRGFFASFQATTIVGGLVLAQACLLALLLISDRVGISEWGWRVAFVAGGVAGLASQWWARGFKRGASGAGTASSAGASSAAVSSSPKPARSGQSSTMKALFRNTWRPIV
ncbi:hypothetical protein [Herbiconiux daphne]|uniref:Major facilitator superfamily (MFS) profile domain-containing protein n=1 Tax=Herbiconiux daphne TaxID=2970914 RepID=A0ABT2GY32_9MICO|nr:hypothetical protein [Herbiconiux daphne]MCS5732872.1 hypothetical protein [Herbiconiux daphne]